jgi:DNA-nicking Smr family endonuclease
VTVPPRTRLPSPVSPARQGEGPPVEVPIQDAFDLHSFFPRDIAPALSDYLALARERGLREVRIIHGKGRGVRRAQVLRVLAGHPLVAEYFDAPPARGGMGATVVILRV